MDNLTEVKLYIYDLSHGMASEMSHQLLGQHLPGIWHTAIVVFEKEYFYGGAGIQSCIPGGTVLGQPLRIENLGQTSVSYQIFKDYLRGLSDSIFKGSKYNLIHHNCNSFSEELSQFLCGTSIPKYILNLPQEIFSSPLGQVLKPVLDQLFNSPASVNFEANTVRKSESSDLDDLDKEIEQIRIHSQALEEQRQKIKKKIAKKEKKLKKNCENPISDMSDETSNENGNGQPELRKSNFEEDGEKETKPAIPPVLYEDINSKIELDELVKLLDTKLSKDEECSVEELHQYLIEDEGSWTLGDNFLCFVERILRDKNVERLAKVHLLRILAFAALKDDVVLILHQDRREHVLMNYAQDIEQHSLEEQQALALFICNLFSNISSSEWLLYISEWSYKNITLSNIRSTTKIAVHCLLAPDETLRDIGSSIMYNLGIKEVKTVVFDDVAVELVMAILQFFNTNTTEDQLFKVINAISRFISVSPDVAQYVQLIGPHPTIFKGKSARIDDVLKEISRIVPEP